MNGEKNFIFRVLPAALRIHTRLPDNAESPVYAV